VKQHPICRCPAGQVSPFQLFRHIEKLRIHKGFSQAKKTDVIQGRYLVKDVFQLFQGHIAFPGKIY
jgi:hypothetical protein